MWDDDQDYWDEDGPTFAPDCSGAHYDMNGLEVCDCRACNRMWAEHVHEERVRKIQKNVDWTQFPKQITLRIPGECSKCHTQIERGELADWDGPATGTIRCSKSLGGCGWQNYPRKCSHCEELFHHVEYFERFQYIGGQKGVYACGSALDLSLDSNRTKRSPACVTIKKLKSRLQPAEPGVTNILDL